MSAAPSPAERSFGKSRLTEAQLTRQVADFLDWALPVGAVFTHIASGGHRMPAVAAKLHGQGVRRGAPDFVIASPGREGGVVVFIELKSNVGVMSADQRKWRDALRGSRARWALCRSVEEVAVVLAEAGVMLRARGAS